ncbi:pseudouridine synthase [Paracoccaceae bacterium GXU_MW_L88]
MKPAPLLHYTPPTDPIRVLHRDADLLVVEKPAGLLSVPGKDPAHADCLITRLEGEGALLIHRLDMDTSGVMVFAMNRPAQRHLGLQFERRHVAKTYEALVEDKPGVGGVIDLPLVCDWPNRPLQKVCHETGRPARTEWRRIGPSRLELTPLTGRSHQLRVHLKELGHPIVGDRFYGTEGARLCLHATRLELYHPADGRRVAFESAAPF